MFSLQKYYIYLPSFLGVDWDFSRRSFFLFFRLRARIPYVVLIYGNGMANVMFNAMTALSLMSPELQKQVCATAATALVTAVHSHALTDDLACFLGGGFKMRRSLIVS